MEHRPKNEVSSADGKALSLSTTRMPVGVRYFFDDVRGRELSAQLALRHLGLASGGDVVCGRSTRSPQTWTRPP